MTWIKICGITNLEDAKAAVDAGADALGFVFYSKSPRNIDPEAARAIIEKIPEGVEKVGVFVDALGEEEVRTANHARLTALQRHLFLDIRAHDNKLYAMGCYWRPPRNYICISTKMLFEQEDGVAGMTENLLRVSENILRMPGADRMGVLDAMLSAVFLDSGSIQQPGGTGKVFDWKRVLPMVDALRDRLKIVIAGGLNADNVAECIHLLHPWGVDVSSGVEEKPGKKDPEKIRAFVRAVREMDRVHNVAVTKVQSKAENKRSLDIAGHLPRKPATPLGMTGGSGSSGRFGRYGGRYVPETLMAALEELEAAYDKARRDKKFQARLDGLLRTYAGRPTPLFFARRLTQKLGGAKIYLKREDLLHTGAHKINNCLGQALLVERMGKKRVIAETGAGQHGVATATVCALFGFECVVYMGTEDMRRQELNVFRMRLLGAEVRGVDSGSRTLKDAINEAMRDWVTNVRTTHYLLGSVLGAHPYPTMVRDFHKVIGKEARAQVRKAEGKLPAAVIACVGGGSNAIGIFHDFIKDKRVKLIGVEAGGRGKQLGEHAARFRGGLPGVLQGTYSYLLQDAAGQVATTHSVSAGLDYPSIGPEHAWLKDSGRAEYVSASDAEALEACTELARTEGIIPALESSHAVAEVIKRAPKMKKSDVVIVNVSGRGDKDVGILRENLKLGD